MKSVLLIVIASAALSADPKPAVQDKVADRFTPAPFEGQTIEGVLGERIHINLEKRLLRVDEEGLLAGFEKRPGKHPWIGEHVGKFLHAAVNSYRLTQDKRLKTLMDRMVQRLTATQLPDGYLGTYTDDQRWTSWDVWVHKYNLIGLLSYYELTSDVKVLESAKKLGDLLAATFGEGKRDIIASSTHVGMAATSVLEPICMLYRYTGEKRYLDFAQYIVRSWEQPNGPKLVSSLLEHGNVHRTANNKAYEMMSDLVGLLDLYRLTAEPNYLKAASAAWDDIASKRLYITGTTSSHEHFKDDHVLPGLEANEVGEGCATVTWLQLTWHMMRLTGEAKYGDQLERTVYNQLLAAQDPSNGNICYFTPLIGTKNATPGINCCVSSEPRGISMIPQLTWGARGRGIAVLLYTAGKVTIGDVQLESETAFPESGKVKLTVRTEANRRFPIYLRVPSWLPGLTVRVSGQQYGGSSNKFVEIDRVWHNGDTIEFEVEPRVQRLFDEKNYSGFVAIQRGPQVLALDLDSNPDVPALHGAALASDKVTPAARAKYGVAGRVVGLDGKPRDQQLYLIPFADGRSVRTWIAGPATLPAAPVSLSAFGRESQSRNRAQDGSIADERPNTYRDTKRGKPSGDDWFAVELPRAALVSRIVFRHGHSAEDGGWFESAPKVQIRREGSREWEDAGVLSDYSSGPKLKDGQPFQLKLTAPVRVAAVRVIGKSALDYVTCAELSAYSE